MSLFGKIGSKVKLEIQKLVFTRVNRYEEVVWLIGTGRSGTTWFASLINHKQDYREMFEPFHPKYMEEMGFLGYHEYARHQTSYPQFDAVADAVFTGRFTSSRVDKENKKFNYNKLLIKDIFGNLFAQYAVNHYKNIKPILIIRNPFAVALSVYEKRDWSWMTDPKDFLRQPKLMADYLSPFKALIEKTSESGDYIEKQILIWCILYYIPLLQFKSNSICVVFYEDLLENPNREMEKVEAFLHPNDLKSIELSSEFLNKPSWVTSRRRKSFSPNDFLDVLTEKQIENGQGILAAFGLDALYDSNHRPVKDAILKLEKREQV